MTGKMNLLQKLGLLLVLLAALALIASELIATGNRAQTQALTSQLEILLSARSEGDPENYSDPDMPVLQLEGQDFSGLLEVPAFGVSLPIGSSWDTGNLPRYPCRFWGSAYDLSLILGGSSGKGQFDFCSRLDLGDKIRVTDMTGTEFSFEVIRIDRRRHADMTVFTEAKSDLILFCPDANTSGYLIVRCEFAP